MGLMDEIRQEGRARKGPACGLQILEDTLDADDLADLREALADPSITSTAISRVLKARGANVGDHTLNRHRRGDCNCEGVSV